MKKLSTLVFLLMAMFCYSQNRICITIDDLPVVDYGMKNYMEVTQGILKALKKYDAPAIGYVNENKLYDNGRLDSSKVALLEMWLQRGLELGNHTYSHMNYHSVNLKEFGEDILKGEQMIKPLSAKYGKEVKYFRHPYLRSGSSQATSDSLKVFLQTNGYIEAPVTIDNEEYLFAKAYAVATFRGDKLLIEKVGEAYLEYMKRQIEYYERASSDLLGRNMDHILLIHANLINAIYLDDLLEFLQEKGYEFVSQADVLKDPAYKQEVTRFSNWGISWIHRWGLSKGLKGDFFKGEAVTPEYIRDLAN